MWGCVGPSEWQPGGRRTFEQLFFIAAFIMHQGAYFKIYKLQNYHKPHYY